MHIIDISIGIVSGMPVWPGDPAVEIRKVSSIERGATANLSILSCGLHTGTHIDAPSHFIGNGDSVDMLPLERLIGKAQVVSVGEGVSLITAEVLKQLDISSGVDRILLHTRNSMLWRNGAQVFCTDFVGLSDDGASWLVEMGVRLIGVDYLSVSTERHGVATHKILLGHGVIIVEGLDLSSVQSGIYEFICLPLKIVGAEGAPARAILLK